MPSSGLNIFTISPGDMISDVLRSIRVNMEGKDASDAQFANAQGIMNMFLKEWTTSGLKLWTYVEVPVPMVANKYVYNIGGPYGDVVLPYTPLRLFETGNYISQTINGAPFNTPLRLISRQEYLQFGAPASVGVPNSIYYNPGIIFGPDQTKTAASLGYGTLSVYVAPSDSSRTIVCNAQRPIQDVTSATAQEFDVPAEWFMAIRSALRYHLGDYYEVPEDRLKRYASEMATYFEKAQDWSTEEASSSFGLDSSGGYGSR